MKLVTVFLALTSLLSAETSPEKSAGPSTAPILMDVFSDFECPHCKILHDQTIQGVITNYASKGKVQLVYRDFPMPKHTHAREAARWANAAARVHKYRQVGDALFQYQEAWSKTGDIRSAVADALTPAEMKTVQSLVNDPGVESAIDQDVKLGVNSGVSGTPTMILTRKLQTYPIQQFISYPIMAQFLDGLAKK
ncbi:MAG: twin-arginine translocation pathway signal [Bryobacterales bacterium]|nr:twin-arginine translocation pathway signal [Bryobacterales bacterium]